MNVPSKMKRYVRLLIQVFSTQNRDWAKKYKFHLILVILCTAYAYSYCQIYGCDFQTAIHQILLS